MPAILSQIEAGRWVDGGAQAIKAAPARPATAIPATLHHDPGESPAAPLSEVDETALFPLDELDDLEPEPSWMPEGI